MGACFPLGRWELDTDKVRSPQEIAQRIRQEVCNVCLWAFPPRTTAAEPSPLAGLPDPDSVAEALKGTPYAAEVADLAESILAHRFPLFGDTVETGQTIEWRRDYLHAAQSGTRYFRFVPYLNFQAVGDHKIVWELNRHQHLVVLAQAWLLTRRREFLRELCLQVDSWLDQNPYMRGMNWASALEVAFRALSWLWAFHLAGSGFEAGFRSRFLTALYRHGCYLETNLSTFFSPNTHLLGEAVALHALGVLFPSFPRAGRWATEGARIVSGQMASQVREDGSHFENSTYYHVYALDMFLFQHILRESPDSEAEKLQRMAEYLAALLGPSGTLPLLGDDDGGRFFHPYGDRRCFGLATLATCGALFDRPEWIADRANLFQQAAWWLGPDCLDAAPPATKAARESCLFSGAGVAVIEEGNLQIVADAGPFGHGSGGHTHADTLSVVARLGEEEILIDPGTYTYVSDPVLRNRFRSTAAHNTVRIDGLEQATPGGPFSWTSRPEATVLGWRPDGQGAWLDAECRYAGVRHRRRLLLVDGQVLFVADEVEGPPGRHVIEQFWHFGETTRPVAPGCLRIGARSMMTLQRGARMELSVGSEYGWRSPVPGTMFPSPVLSVQFERDLPALVWTVLDFSGPAETSLTVESPGKCVYRANGREITVDYAKDGPPVCREAVR